MRRKQMSRFVKLALGFVLLWPAGALAGDAAGLRARVHTSLSVQNSNFGFRAGANFPIQSRTHRRQRQVVIVPYGYAAPLSAEAPAREPEVIRSSERPKVEYNITIQRPAPRASGEPYQLRAATYIAPSGSRARLAELFYQARNYSEAAFNLERLVARNPEVAHFRFFYAEALFAQGRYDEAAEQIAAGVERDPEFVRAERRLTERYHYYEDFEAQLAALERQVKRDPGRAAPVLVLAYVCHFTGQQSRARALFESLVEKSPYRGTARAFLSPDGALSSDSTEPVAPRSSETPQRVDL